MKFEGIYTPIVTPHRDDFSIDYDRLAEIVDFLVAGGVHGIISAGTTGEYYAQTMEERCELMKFIQQRVKGRTSYIVGTGALRTEESIEYAKAAVEVGADALLVATPPYSLPTERENALHALGQHRHAQAGLRAVVLLRAGSCPPRGRQARRAPRAGGSGRGGGGSGGDSAQAPLSIHRHLVRHGKLAVPEGRRVGARVRTGAAAGA